MATWNDVRRIARALPGTAEQSSRGIPQWRVKDKLFVWERPLRKSDLQGSAGIYRLKEELRRRVNIAIYPEQVDSILFKEILVQ